MSASTSPSPPVGEAHKAFFPKPLIFESVDRDFSLAPGFGVNPGNLTIRHLEIVADHAGGLLPKVRAYPEPADINMAIRQDARIRGIQARAYKLTVFNPFIA